MVKGFGSQLQNRTKFTEKKPNKKTLASVKQIQDNLCSYLSDIPDPRVSRTQKHLLKDILAIAILAVIGGAEGWEDMENYGIAKQQWLEEFLELDNGIPSDDTFRRVFERIKPEALEKCLNKWLQTIMGSLKGEIIPIDGKSLRGSYDRNLGQSTLHLVTAWASEQRLVLGQVKDAQLLCRAIRTHWSIENQLHWTLDVTFNEERSRIRSGHSPRNFAFLRRLALNALNQETTFKRSLRQKRKQAAMNDDYMMTVLNTFCQA
jgi:predicted transposase YbfD/YdcC